MSKKIKFEPDFELQEDDEVVFEFENEVKALDPLSVEEAVSRIICFNNPENPCDCKTSLKCDRHEKYRASALSAIVVVLSTEGFLKPKNLLIEKKDIN